jgi:ABC-2 type transport system permease protein
MVLRYLYLYRRSLARAGEVFFWPVMDLLVWGFVTSYLQRMAVPDAVLFLIGGMIFWDVLYRSQQAITLSLGEEIFVRNIINIFVAPISVFEIMLATCLMGVIKAIITAVVLGVLAHVLFAFNLLEVGPALVPFLVSLLLFGWAVGMCTMALILRFGQAAEALIWGIPFLLQPISAVFYPLDVLPGWLQVVARFFPSSYVFEGMRAALATGRVAWSAVAACFAMNLLWLAIGATFFGWMFHVVRDRGYLSRLGME